MNANYISTSSFSAGLIAAPRSYILLGLDLSPSDLYGSFEYSHFFIYLASLTVSFTSTNVPSSLEVVQPASTELRRDVSGAQLRLQLRPRSNFGAKP
jgi:hypothetical protein